MTIKDCKLIELPKFLDQRGNLSFAQNNAQIPFVIKRTYWLYDVPGGECRGGHAYRETEELVIAMSGSFDVTIDDGMEKKPSISTARTMVSIFLKDCGVRWRISLPTPWLWNLHQPNTILMITSAITMNS